MAPTIRLISMHLPTSLIAFPLIKCMFKSSKRRKCRLKFRCFASAALFYLFYLHVDVAVR